MSASDISFPAYLISSGPAGLSADFTTLTDADLDPGDVTVRVQYASINFKDALAATGKGKIIRRFPCVGGIDATGVVESSGAPKFKPGDAVIVHSHGFGVSHHGGYAARARVPAAWVNRLPLGMSALEGITLGVAGSGSSASGRGVRAIFRRMTGASTLGWATPPRSTN
jgi:alcohol dehydrogenase